jgi:hypothetical protein
MMYVKDVHRAVTQAGSDQPMESKEGCFGRVVTLSKRTVGSDPAKDCTVVTLIDAFKGMCTA